MNPLLPGTQVLLAALVLTAGVYDIRFRRIPNWLVLAGLVAGFAWNVGTSGIQGLILAAEGMGLALLIYLPLYAIRAMGAGDVKLMAAVGAVTGPRTWFLIFLCTAILGGVLALALVLWNGRLRTTIWNVGYIVRELVQFRAPYLTHEQLDVRSKTAVTLPHGVSIALGSLVVMAWFLMKTS